MHARKIGHFSVRKETLEHVPGGGGWGGGSSNRPDKTRARDIGETAAFAFCATYASLSFYRLSLISSHRGGRNYARRNSVEQGEMFFIYVRSFFPSYLPRTLHFSRLPRLIFRATERYLGKRGMGGWRETGTLRAVHPRRRMRPASPRAVEFLRATCIKISNSLEN